MMALYATVGLHVNGSGGGGGPSLDERVQRFLESRHGIEPVLLAYGTVDQIGLRNRPTRGKAPAV
jgi:hypothetical protein